MVWAVAHKHYVPGASRPQTPAGFTRHRSSEWSANGKKKGSWLYKFHEPCTTYAE